MAELSEEHGKVLIEADGSGNGQPVQSSSASFGGRGSNHSRPVEVGFIPNDTFMDASCSLHVVSGVNGSGKTT